VNRAAAGRLAVDGGVALGTLSLALGNDLWDSARGRPVTSALDVALVLPLLWRRRHPTPVFLVIAATALAQWWLGRPAAGDIAVLVALYAVGAHEPRRPRVVAAAAIALLGVALVTVRWTAAGDAVETAILLTGTATAAGVLGVHQRTRHAYLGSLLERAATAERERDQQALIATVTERARISGELHDIVAHSLSVMIALSDGAAAAVARTPGEAESTMRQVSAYGRQALGEIRRLLGTVTDDDDGPARHPPPGLADLPDLVDQLRAAGLPVRLVVLGPVPDVSPLAGLTVFRIVQEALTNVLKHAPSAVRAVVTLRYDPAGVVIEVDNDDPRRSVRSVRVVRLGEQSKRAADGLGLSGMRQRAAAFGGTLDAGRRDGGWRVRTHLRWTDREAG
jgi:signal transduction histidine kinase